MRCLNWTVAFLCLGVMGSPGIAADSDDAAVFESLYGRKIQKAAATPPVADDVALAAELFDAASQSRDHPGLLKRLCESAYTLGMKDPAGFDAAIAALRLIRQAQPEASDDVPDRLSAALQRQYAQVRGERRIQVGESFLAALQDQSEQLRKKNQDADSVAILRKAQSIAAELNSGRLPQIRQSLAQANRRIQVLAQIQTLLQAAKARPQDAAVSRQVALLYLVELDSPQQAAPWADRGEDQKLARMIHAAGQSLSAVSEDDALALGDWYRELSDAAPETSKSAMILRAGRYYEYFLQRHPANDLTRKKAELAQRELAAAAQEQAKSNIASSGGKAAAPASVMVMDLVKAVELDAQNLGEYWKISNTGIRLSRPRERERENTLLLPARPTGNYRLEMEFERTDGLNQIRLCLPVGQAAVTLVMNNTTRACGICTVEATPTRGSLTEKTNILNDNRAINSLMVMIATRGDEAQIDAQLNGKPFVQWRGPVASLKTTYAPPEAVGRLALCARDIGLIFHSMSIKALTGDLKVMPTIDAAPASAPVAAKSKTRSEPPVTGNKLAEALRPPAGMRQTYPGAEIAAGPEWVDLLQSATIPDNRSNDWKKQDAGIVMKTGKNVEMIFPAADLPASGYELVMRCKYTGSTNDNWIWMGAMFPIGPEHRVTLNLQPGKGTGLGTIDNAKATDNETFNRRFVMDPDRWHEIYIRVESKADQASIVIGFNHQGVIQWSGHINRLGMADKPLRMSLGGSHCQVTYSSVKVRPLPGN